MPSNIRVALIGAGYIASWHANALNMTQGAELVAVCDLSPAAANDLATAYGVQAFTAVEDLIAAEICDAVHILTPPPSHAALALTCLEAGFHVLVEKPFALNSADAAAVGAAAERAGRLAGVCHNFLGLPKYDRLKAAIEAGALGRVSAAELNWRFPLVPLRSGPYGLWMLQKPENILFELGPHLFAFAHDLFGAPEEIMLRLDKPVTFPAGEVRPQSWRILARAGHVELAFTLSLVETFDDRSITVHGSSGRARLDFASDTLIFDRESASDIVIGPFKRQLSLARQSLGAGLANGWRQFRSLNRQSPYALSFQATFSRFYAAIASGTSLDPGFSPAAGEAVTAAIAETAARIGAPYRTDASPADPAPEALDGADVLVIGGTGFIGRHLTRTLVARGHRVRVVSRGRRGPFADLAGQVETVRVSLRDKDALVAAMQGVGTVFNLAKSADSTWEGCLENDVGVAVRIAEAALEAGVDRLIYTGTIASYDMSDPNRPITEETRFADDMTDRNLYARSKAECERRLMAMHRDQGLPLVIARPGIVIGEGGPLQHWGIGRWHGAGAVRIWGDGRNTLPFVLIEDVSDALIRMMDRPKAIGQSFNLIGPPMMGARDYFDAIHQTLGARIDVRPGSLWAFWLSGKIKYLLKRHVIGLKGLHSESYRDWKSRAHLSPFRNDHARSTLGWHPEDDRDVFIEKGITNANLFGF